MRNWYYNVLNSSACLTKNFIKCALKQVNTHLLIADSVITGSLKKKKNSVKGMTNKQEIKMTNCGNPSKMKKVRKRVVIISPLRATMLDDKAYKSMMKTTDDGNSQTCKSQA